MIQEIITIISYLKHEKAVEFTVTCIMVTFGLYCIDLMSLDTAADVALIFMALLVIELIVSEYE
jgi:hypothetical protein